MNNPRTVRTISLMVLVLVVAVSAIGLFWRTPLVNDTVLPARGDAVELDGRGLYRFDSVSYAAQGRAQDLVTLAVGAPMLLIGVIAYGRGSIRGYFLVAGTLFYCMYSYLLYGLGASFNELFIAYVAIFALSTAGLVVVLSSTKTEVVVASVGDGFPRRTIAWFGIVVGLLITAMWLMRIVPAYTDGTAPFGLEHYTTLPIQFADLAVVVPVAVVGGIMLLRRRPAGVLLSMLFLVKGFTLALAVCAMIAGQAIAGVDQSLGEAIPFVAITVAGVTLFVIAIRSVGKRSRMEQ